MRFLFVGWGSDYHRIELEELLKKDNIQHVTIPRLFKKFSRIFKNFSKNLYHDINSLYLMVTAISKDDVIILQDGLKYSLILKFRPDKTFVIFRNTVDSNNQHLLSSRISFTFDPIDAKKHSMILYNQYIPSIDYLREKRPCISYDIAFVGLRKGREETLEALQKLLIKHQILVDFVDSNIYSYDEYIRRQYSAKVIIELGKANQSGPSMRAIEALALGRKIITNNYNLKSIFSFAEENIFVTDKNTSEADLDNFIQSEFSPIPEDDIRQFESRYVLNEILKIIKREIEN